MPNMFLSGPMRFPRSKLQSILPFAYLYLPIVLFLCFWIKLFLAVPILILLLLAFLFLPASASSVPSRFPYLALIFVLCLLWCAASGLGGFVVQASDWSKHNILLQDLIERSWPVCYTFDGETGVLVYYLAGYLLPAAIGKFTSFDFAQIVLLFWSALGIFLTVVSFYRALGKDKPSALFWIFLFFFLFATLSKPLSYIYGLVAPDDVADGVHWLSKAVLVQYSPNIISLRWVFPQFITPSLCVALLLENRYRYSVWGLIAVPLILYSTFAFIGFAALLVLLFVFDLLTQGGPKKKRFLKCLSIPNVASFFLALVLSAYIACNFLQPKPEDAQMGFSFVDYSQHPLVFILFQLAWLIWVFLILRKEYANPLLWSTCILLFLIPFVSMGRWNDFCMRTSIPLLSLLCFLVVKVFLSALSEKRIPFIMVTLLCLALASYGPLGQLNEALEATSWGQRNYSRPYEESEEFYTSTVFVHYQYIDWSHNGLAEFLLQESPSK